MCEEGVKFVIKYREIIQKSMKINENKIAGLSFMSKTYP